MPFLNLDLNYFSHPKTKRLIGLLGRGAEVLPIRIWCHCGAHHAESGRLAGYSAQEIESIVEWWGKPSEAVEAMVKVGFLELKNGEYAVHDWKKNQGHISAFHRRAIAINRIRWKNYRREVRLSYKNPTRTPKTHFTEPPTIPYQTTKPPPSPPFRGWFESIWRRYPRPKGKKAAFRHFLASVKTDEDWRRINQALDNYLAELKRDHVETKFVRHASTWFNDWESWLVPDVKPVAGEDGSRFRKEAAARARHDHAVQNEDELVKTALTEIQKLPEAEQEIIRQEALKRVPTGIRWGLDSILLPAAMAEVYRERQEENSKKTSQT